MICKTRYYYNEKHQEQEFSFRLVSRQYNSQNQLDLLNGELETRTQEQ